MDPLAILFENAWRRFAARFWTLVWIFLAPAVFLVAGRLLSARAGSGVFAAGAILSLVGTVLSIMATIALINALARGTGVGASWRVGAKLFWPAVWIGILNIVAIAGGFALLVVPGVILAIALAFANYVLVVEDRRGLQALVKSRAYVAGRWWAVVGRALIAAGIFILAMVLIYDPLFFIFGSVIGAVAYLAILVCFTAFSTAYTYEIYENLRRLAAAPAAAALGVASPRAADETAKSGKLLSVCLAAGVIVLGLILMFAIASSFGRAG